MKNVVVISSSLRTESSSRILALEVVKGLEKNNNVKFIDLKNMHLEFCRGCLACEKTKKCVINDDVKIIIDSVKNADILLFASPIYYYSISGQLKTFLDRLNPLYQDTYKFSEVYSLFTCADESESATEGPKMAIQGWVDCFEHATYKNSFNATNICCPSSITEELKHEAYIFGTNIK